MKELESKSQDPLKQQVAENRSVEVEKKKALIGRIRLRKGQKLYKCNLDTGEILEVQIIDPTTVGYNGQSRNRFVEDVEPNEIFVTALNIKNAKRKFANHVDKLIRQLKARNEQTNRNPV